MDRKNRTHILAKFLKMEGHMIGVMRWRMVVGEHPGSEKRYLADELGNPGTWPTTAIRFLMQGRSMNLNDYSHFKWHGVPITEFVRFLRDSGTDPTDF